MSVLQYVAVYCSVWQCVAVFKRHSCLYIAPRRESVAVCCSVFTSHKYIYIAPRYCTSGLHVSVLKCVAVRCSVHISLMYVHISLMYIYHA